MLCRKLLKLVRKSSLMLHSLQYLCTAELIPRGCDYGSLGIVLSQKTDACIQLLLRDTCCTAEDDAVCVLDLIIIELAEVLHIHLALVCVSNGCEAIQHNVLHVQIFNSADNIAQLADAGRLDEDSVRMELLKHLFKGLTEITDKAAADAAGVHFRDLYTGILQKAAVYCYLAEFILDKHKLLAAESLLDELLDKRCFARAEKAGENVYFSHVIYPSFEQ